MPAGDRATDRVAIASGDLQVVFVRSGDRFAHYLAHTAAHDEILLASVEGTDDDAWPASPPWQELHVERRGELLVALLVGRAGRSHWSMSVEPDDHGLLFDVACRTSGKVDLLASTYRLVDAATPVIAGKSIRFAAECELHVLTGTIELSADLTARIVPPHHEPSTSQTIRWKYRLLSLRDR